MGKVGAKNRKPKVITSKTFEKAKVKVGRKLKSHTETNTDFKAKKLILLSQLKVSSGEEPLSRRKLSFAELCNHLSHHNINVRKDSLIGIKELFTSHPELIGSNLSLSAEKIFPLLHDLEGSVRKLVVAVLTLIFRSTPIEEIRPHLTLLVSNVSCALTHISDGNQSTGLELVEVLLDFYADFIRSHFPLTKSILTVTSVTGKSSTATMGNVREEEMNQSGVAKLFSRKKKLRLLSVLDKLLMILSRDYKCEGAKELQLPQNHFAPYLVPIITVISGNSMERPLENPENLRFVCRKVAAFLHDVWLEITTPDNDSGPTDLSFTPDQIRVMSTVIKMHIALIQMFRHISEEFEGTLRNQMEREMRQFYGKSHLSAYFGQFPKRLRTGVKQKKAQKSVKSNHNSPHAGDSSDTSAMEACLLLNLRLSHLSSILESSGFTAKVSLDWKLVNEFPLIALETSMRSDLLNYCLTVAEAQLRSLKSVDDRKTEWTKALLGCFHRCNSMSKAKMIILEIVWGLIQDDLWEVELLLKDPWLTEDLCLFRKDSVEKGKVEAVDLASKVSRHLLNFATEVGTRQKLAESLSVVTVD